MVTSREFLSLLRTDFCAFIEKSFNELNPHAEYLPNWHVEVMAAELEAVRFGYTKRLIINLPPRSLKSHAVSIAFTAWLLGHQPSAQIICASYGQDLAAKLSMDCRTLMSSRFYQQLFPTRLSAQRQAVQEFATTEGGFRLATSIGGVLTGRGADFIIIDDPLKPDEAVSDVRRKAVNDWFDQSLVSRLNDKRQGCIVLIMQRLHEDDLVGHVLEQGGWKLLRFPAIAEEHELYTIETPYGTRVFQRHAGEALHPEREPVEVLQRLRTTLGEYNFAGQYQQAPAPLGGGMVKREWLKTYTERTLPKFDYVLQSWDTANSPSELSDYSVCTTWGVEGQHLYLTHVLRKHLSYPELKRAVQEQAQAFHARTVLIENKASGIQLIQELTFDLPFSIRPYQPSMDKVMRMNSVTTVMENGFVYLPDKAFWLEEYLHELSVFPHGKHDDQADSTSQALDWFRNENDKYRGITEFFNRHAEELDELSWWPGRREKPRTSVCPNCGNQSVARYGQTTWRCFPCGASGEDPR